jgi:hypothetical protein
MRVHRPRLIVAAVVSVVSVVSAVSAVSLAAPVPAVAAQQKEVRIPLSNADAKDVAAAIRGATGSNGKRQSALPIGIVSLNADKKRNELVAVGTPDAIEELRGLVGLMDIAPRNVRIDVRVVRVLFGPNGQKTESTLTSPAVTTATNKTAHVAIPDTTKKRTVVLELTPRFDDEGAITLVTLLGMKWESGSSTGIGGNLHTRDKQFHRISGITNTEDKALIQIVGQGQIPDKWTKAFSAYYLEVSARESTESKPSAP